MDGLKAGAHHLRDEGGRINPQPGHGAIERRGKAEARFREPAVDKNQHGKQGDIPEELHIARGEPSKDCDRCHPQNPDQGSQGKGHAHAGQGKPQRRP